MISTSPTSCPSSAPCWTTCGAAPRSSTPSAIGRLSDDDEAALRAAVESFRSTYLAGGKMLSGEVAAAEEEAPAEHTAEQIVLKRS